MKTVTQTTAISIFRGAFLLGLISMGSACVIAEPREGYWDHDHHRYYHEHGWHECGPGNQYCR